MNDDVRPSREGLARLRSGSGGRIRDRFLRELMLLAGLIATIPRTAAAAAEASAVAPLVQRAAGLVGVVLEIIADPMAAIVIGTLATTIAGTIAVWRRSVGAGVTVAAGLFALLGLAGKY